jgi:hypothetical protein
MIQENRNSGKQLLLVAYDEKTSSDAMMSPMSPEAHKCKDLAHAKDRKRGYLFLPLHRRQPVSCPAADIIYQI